jgi:succinate dehydrogenase/fumarate reductase flavoprotein subunit
VELLESWGHLFQRDAEGRIGPEVAFYSGGHSKPRTLGCPPSKGVGMGNALRQAAAGSGIRVLEETAACKLLRSGGLVSGAVCFDLNAGSRRSSPPRP